MKSKITLFFLALNIVYCFAQKPPKKAYGGEFVFNSEKSECLTESQRLDVIKTLKTNVALLKKEKRLLYTENKSGNHPLFLWPLKKSNTSNYNEIYGISGFVDHNTSYPDQLTDYNCGSRSYDTNSGYNHQGIDMFTWPFGWKMMNNDEVEIIAAAPGQIISKSDGNFDRSCDFNTTTPWNAIYVQHSDGSIAWYGHMKNGSTTSKNVGDNVTEGEYLGIVGSSGISTGPHLHFEVYTDASYTQLVDPYTGSCNSFNSDSWWQTQRPYNNPGINAVLTHTADPVFPACPTTEITNESTQFDLNQPIHTAIYLKDQIAGTSVNLRLIKPDNTDLYNWNFNLTDNFVASWWRWIFNLDIQGEWKWQATYNGETVTQTFNVGSPLSIDEEDFNSTSVYPNPFNDVVNINSTTKIKNASVVDMLGKTILVFNKTSEQGIKELNLSTLSNGVYFIILEGYQHQKKTIKLIKK